MLAEELKAVATQERDAIACRRGCINVCGAAGCQSLQSDALKKALVEAAVVQGYSAETYAVRKVGCLGLCGAGPLVSVEPSRALYQRVKPSDAGDIVAAMDGPP